MSALDKAAQACCSSLAPSTSHSPRRIMCTAISTPAAIIPSHQKCLSTNCRNRFIGKPSMTNAAFGPSAKTPTIQRNLRRSCAVRLPLHRCVNPFEKSTHFVDRPDRHHFDTALVKHDLHFL